MTSTNTTSSESPSERRRLQHREEARRTILDATEALLVEGGYDGFSMRRLADRCGYTAPTIYHYFADKQRLIDEVVEERLRPVLEGVGGVDRGAGPVETLRTMLTGFARFGIENPTHYRLLSLPRPDDSPPPPAAEELRALLEEPISELAAAGRLTTANVEEAVQFLWVMLHGVISLRITRPDVEWCDGLVDFSMDSSLRGLVKS